MTTTKRFKNSPPINALQFLNFLFPPDSFLLGTNDDRIRQYHKRLLLVWPPNLFAFTAGVLSMTGAYSKVSPLTDGNKFTEVGSEYESLKSAWERFLNAIGDNKGEDGKAEKTRVCNNFNFLLSPVDEWRERYTPPEVIQQKWEGLYAFFNKSGTLNEIWDESHKDALKDLVLLNAVADSLCLGWGIREFHEKKQPRSAYLFAQHLLKDYKTLATIDPSRVRILPKRHTPQVGVALRSMSLHLAYHRSSVDVNWVAQAPQLLEYESGSSTGEGKNQNVSDGSTDKNNNENEFATLSLLLLPWPLKVRARDFNKIKPVSAHRENGVKQDMGFEYSPKENIGSDLRLRLRQVIDEALKEIPRIDIAILPECAISESQLDDLQDSLGGSIKAYFTGIRRTKKTPDKLEATNSMVFGWSKNTTDPDDHERKKFEDMPGLSGRYWFREFQDKHHRWGLTKWQIESYQLGGVLHPDYNWWESIEIKQRKVTFINFGDELTICPLICEDLARQDPIADLIRSVGPSLVVGLLMDGPQLASRWSARYASVLADDPGSSVITLTSAGMVDRYSISGKKLPRIIGLWSDQFGPSKEIVLEDDSQAVVLSLAVNRIKEKTLDGRVETEGTYTLSLGGIHQIKISEIK